MPQAETTQTLPKMLTVRAALESLSVYSQSKAFESVKDSSESHDDFENRCWRERMHVSAAGNVVIPPMAIKNCLVDAAQFLAETVPGKRSATYTKHFKAGVMVIEPVELPVKAADVEPARLFVPSDGRRGGGSRVYKNFPKIESWKGTADIVLIDPVLIAKPEKVEEYLTHAGHFIGMGFFRPIRGGYWGRFAVSSFEIVEPS